MVTCLIQKYIDDVRLSCSVFKNLKALDGMMFIIKLIGNELKNLKPVNFIIDSSTFARRYSISKSVQIFTTSLIFVRILHPSKKLPSRNELERVSGETKW